MQNHMQTHTPPSFLQQYGSWIGYAAAASVTSVMAFLYVNQLSQNDHLVQDVKNLQSQIEVIRNQPAQVAKTDTVYVLQTAPDGQSLQASARTSKLYRQLSRFRQPLRGDLAETGSAAAYTEGPAESGTIRPALPLADNSAAAPGAGAGIVNAEKSAVSPGNAGGASQVSAQGLAGNTLSGQYAGAGQPTGANAHSGSAVNPPIAPGNARTFDAHFEIASIDAPIEMNTGTSLKRKMQYELAGKLSSRQVQKALLANHMQIAKAPVSGKKAEQVAQTESVIPKLPLKTPYRFGAGYQVEGNGSGKTVLGEVIIKKKFSIAAGITWLKVKPAEFFNETVFREKNRRDFKTAHPGEVPLIFNLYNIKIDQSVVQMPLTLAFRNTMKDDWAYYASMGTNIKLSSRETISFDCRGPKNEFFNQTISKSGDLSAITSMNFAVGVEKTWHPIVVQAEAYWFNYFKASTPLRQSAGPGLKVKLLYQIGRQM